MQKNETKKLTKHEILEMEYASTLRYYERKVQKYALRMVKDYEHFFRWYGGEMYKAQVNLKAVRELHPMLGWDDLEKTKTWIEGYIGNIELTLIEGSQYPTGTSLMHNVAETLSRAAQQELRQDLQRLLHIITCNI